MSHSLKNQNRNKTLPEKKKIILTLAVSALTAVTAGMLLVYQLRNTESHEIQQVDNTVPETAAETKVLETDLSAAASVQKEITDVISESARESVSETVILTEYVTEQETHIQKQK